MACPVEGPPIYLGLSRGLCRECREMVDVRYVSDGKNVFLERLCSEHGKSRAIVAESLAWYLDALKAPVNNQRPNPLTHRTGECAQSCGPCEFHAQACNLPVFSITNACNLRCPICFTYNRSDAIYNMPADEFRRQIDFVVEATGGVDLINITGGEPTLHPQLVELVRMAKRPEIGRVTVNTNGVRLAEDVDLVKQLADLGAYVILSLDTFDPQRSVSIHGRDITEHKKRALDNLERFELQTTILTVLIDGVNDDELGPLADLALGREHVRSWTIQAMTFTGQGGGRFQPRRHIPVDGVARRIEEATGNRITCADFVPLPTAHPLCYNVAYLLADDDGTVHSFVNLLSRQTLSSQLGGGYLLQPSNALESELRAAINRLWSRGENPSLLAAVKQLLRALYPPGENLTVHERQRRAEQRVKTIYIHAHMDEDTYEVGRAMRCPDQVPVGAERLIGACNYNLFYRMQDERFWVEPQ